jgi:hypothetical protein
LRTVDEAGGDRDNRSSPGANDKRLGVSNESHLAIFRREVFMVAPRPENPDADVNEIEYPETVPDASPDDEQDEQFDPGTELLPEKDACP